MQLNATKIIPCLWFDGEAEEAAKFYVSVFKNSRILNISYYGKEGFEVHGRREGTVMTAEFELDGQRFVGLNGGPNFKFTEAVSFQIMCEDQEEVDYFWSKLTAGGKEVACGWLKDKFGLSWQVVPTVLMEMMKSGDDRSERVMKAFMQMKKFDVAALERAYAGEELAAAKQ
jgi:predicted 3-demethylubiquinone-9 3-methyltransferase (glyoxalase superfamily)